MDTEFLLPLRQGQIEVTTTRSGMEDIAHAVLLDRHQVSCTLNPDPSILSWSWLL